MNSPLDPLSAARNLAVHQTRREMELLFATAVSAAVESIDLDEAAAQKLYGGVSSNGGTGGGQDYDLNGKTAAQRRRRNLDVSRVTMLTLSAMAAAAGK